MGYIPIMSEKYIDRIQDALEAKGLSMKQASLNAGLGETFVRDLLRRRRRPSVHAMEKLAEALGTSVAELTHDEESGDLRNLRSPIAPVKVIGRVAANTWLSIEDAYDDGEEYVPTATGYPADWQFGLIVQGNCLNRIANDGDRLVCLDVIKAHLDIKANDLVIVERSRYDGQMIERTAKRIRQTIEGYELWPESDDPNHQMPIKLAPVAEGEEIRVMGLVLWILKRP